MVKLGEVFDEIRREGFEKGFMRVFEKKYEEGFEKSFELGQEHMLLANVCAVMKNMSLTAEEAFDLFDVPNEKRQKYLAML